MNIFQFEMGNLIFPPSSKAFDINKEKFMQTYPTLTPIHNI